MRKSIVYFIVLLLTSSEIYAQVTPVEETKDRVILKFAPLSFFDIDNTIQAGFEIPFSGNRFTINQEFGYGHSVFNPWYIELGDSPDKWTFRSRSQFRFYFHEWNFGRIYVAGEYMRKRVTAKEEMWVGVNCTGNNAGCDYFEFRDVTARKIVNALHTKIGWHFYFPNRVTLDLYVGGGLRMKTYKSEPENNGRNVNFEDGRWFGEVFWDEDGPYPSLALGFQLGIPLNWRIGRKP